jgi:heptosyltransferase-2
LKPGKIICDALLPLICRFLAIFKKRKPLEARQNILVIKFNCLGPAILSLPMIEAIRAENPDSKITVLGTKKIEDVFKGQPFVDSYANAGGFSTVLFILKSLWKYDVVIDTQQYNHTSAIISFFTGKRSIGYSGNSRSMLFDVTVPYNGQQHVVYAYCDLLSPLGIYTKPAKLPPLKVNSNGSSIVSLRLQKGSINLGRKMVIGIHPFCGSSTPWKAWPKHNFSRLIDKIKAKYDPIIILTGSDSESGWNRELINSLTNKMNVHNISNLPTASLFYLMTKYDIMISNDSAMMHIAAAQGIPTVALFGPTSPKRVAPLPHERNISLYHQTPGHPVSDVHKRDSRPCDGKCMELITVDEVFDAVEKLIKSKKGQINVFS